MEIRRVFSPCVVVMAVIPPSRRASVYELPGLPSSPQQYHLSENIELLQCKLIETQLAIKVAIKANIKGSVRQCSDIKAISHRLCEEVAVGEPCLYQQQ